MAPFLGRPAYQPLARPHDPPRATPYPKPPPALVGMEFIPGYLGAGALARVAQRLNISLADIDARMTVDEVLDELDLQAYIYDVDAAPQPPPKKPPGGRH